MKISTRKVLVKNKHGLRLNFPHTTGWLQKLDRFLFDYGDAKGLPCFLPTWHIRNQLIVDDVPIYHGGGYNCFEEPMSVRPTIVNKKQLALCKEVAYTRQFRVQNYYYNGFFSKAREGMCDFVVRIEDAKKSSDAGCYICKCSDGKRRNIPSTYILGIQVLFKPKKTDEVPQLFGEPSEG